MVKSLIKSEDPINRIIGITPKRAIPTVYPSIKISYSIYCTSLSITLQNSRRIMYCRQCGRLCISGEVGVTDLSWCCSCRDKAQKYSVIRTCSICEGKNNAT